MAVGARKLLTSALGLTLLGSLLGGPPAAAAEPGASGPAPTAHAVTWYEAAVAPMTAPAGTPVQVHGYVSHQADGIFDEVRPSRNVPVKIYFDPAGSTPRQLVATVVTNDEAWFEKTFRPTTSGTYDVLAANHGIDSQGTRSVEFTKRAASQPVRSAVTSGTKDGVTARARVTVQDVVTRIEPQTVYLDAAILVPGASGNAYAGPSMTNRRAEGRFSVGEFYGGDQDLWRTDYSGVRTYQLSAVHPAGLYSVYYEGPIGVFTDRWDSDGDGGRDEVRVPMPWKPITTIHVRRASSTTISASSTVFTGPRTITLRGAVRKVQLITDTEAGIRLSPNTPVKLYFDPAGARGPVYKKTVRTNSDGVYTTKVGTSISGRWIAKYPGTDLQALSQRDVTITVR